MSRTKLFGALALMACSLAVLGFELSVKGQTAPQPGEKAQPPSGVDPKMAHFLVCAKACDDCARICDLCGAHCMKLAVEGKKEHLETARTCMDCASVCSAASCVVAKHGPFSDLICTACAEACKRCGDACEKHAQHDPIMKQCADECRRCEKACREMLKNTPKGGR